MDLDAYLMTAEPESVAEAFDWVDSLLAEVPHGKSFWQLEQELDRVRVLVSWIRERCHP